jgi:hypothetical protein
MVANAFKQVDDLMALEASFLEVVEEAFRVTDELQEGRNEGYINGDAKPPFDNKGQ